VLAELRDAQAQFKDAHKALERAAAGGGGASASATAATGGAPRTPSELKRDIGQLEDERGQLVEKIASLKKRSSDLRGFAPLLEATAALRKEQEAEAQLSDRLHEQRAALAAAERR
jgi:hypothetical protein